MTDSLDAVETSRRIKETYRRYLKSLMQVREPAVAAALTQAIDESPLLDKGPYLEATPPYAPRATVQDLVEEGVLCESFLTVTGPALPKDRPLYAHQESALRKAAAGRNVVVATGTGSGKTESFLLPIVDRLCREREAGTLGPGVRALLLYPMNALANDQMKRLRELLAHSPDLTFGRYTGDTARDARRAREQFDVMNPGQPRLPNELLSREEMQETPPHLLLTNYAMLEYLLLRPLDFRLFGTEDTWQFVVVDEAHVYDGTQGAEIAMLLRRLKDRVAPGRSLQCIATSATVGGEADRSEVTSFASNLFGAPFEWVEGDPRRQDLVTATRVVETNQAAWGPLGAEHWASVGDSGLAPGDLSRIAPVVLGHMSEPQLLATEANMVALRRHLANGPQPIDAVAADVFGDHPQRIEALSSLVAAGAALRRPDGSTVLSARYHLFLRATEGAFTCLSEQGPHVQLARHDHCPDCRAAMFQLGACVKCGAPHLAGHVEQSDDGYQFLPPRGGQRPTWLVLDEALDQVDEDEDAVEQEEASLNSDAAALCTHCGYLGAQGAVTCPRPECRGSSLRRIRRLTRSGEDVPGCLVCGARGEATVRGLESGGDATGSVLGTALYQNLGGEPGSPSAAARKLLMFSDSRQSAAYFAPYIETSYARLRRRRLLVQALVEAGADTDPVDVEDLVYELVRVAKAAGEFAPGITKQKQMRQVAPWVMAELVSTDVRQSLEGVGLVRVDLWRDPRWVAPAPLTSLGLDQDEAFALLAELARTLRMQGAVSMPDNVVPDDEIFSPRLGPVHVRGDQSEPRRKVLAWSPTRGVNKRLDYLTRVLAALGQDQGTAELLKQIWAFLTDERSPVSWLKTTNEPQLGVVRQIDHEQLRLSWVSEAMPTYQCDVCRTTTGSQVRGVCPSLRCPGTLRPFVPPGEHQDGNHYRQLYRTMSPVPLTAKEHTAQWTTEEARVIQDQFVRGEVNALSCSTTFELGVDVGELQAVLLRNMPPGTANYLQRAGRAGRRTGAAALVVTYAQRRSHDLTRYATPEVMMAGAIRAPFVPLTNVRIDRRHAHSVAMSAFFRAHFETTGRIFRKAGEFFAPESGELAPVDLVRNFLTPVPDHLRESLRRVLPASVATELGVDDDAWVQELLSLLERARQELTSDVAVLTELEAHAAKETKYSLAGRYKMVIQTLMAREILGHLANRNVLPKYGFPVDSVELRTGFSQEKHSTGKLVDLTRDLSRAVYEYAPGSEVVAGGRVWTSRGVYRLPGRALEEFRYRVCPECSAFWRGLEEVDPLCPQCGSLHPAAERTFTVPEFGFVAAQETTTPGSRPPKQHYGGASYVMDVSPVAQESTTHHVGGRVHLSVGPRGRMIALSDGPNRMGYRICDWCGYGEPRSLQRSEKKPAKHVNPIKGTPCAGMTRLLDLAHTYETDLLDLTFEVPGQWGQAAWKSVMYAVVEAASEALEIARDDIGVTLSPSGVGAWSVALFDTVPGGAGNVLTIAEQINKVLRVALLRVSRCECGPETSCYSCLRSYSNQRDHEVLSRGVARDLLGALLGAELGDRDETGLESGPEAVHLMGVSEVPEQWRSAWGDADESERTVLSALWDEPVAAPVVGAEIEGIPVGLCWPDARVACDGELSPADVDVLVTAGWQVVPAEPSMLLPALAARVGV